MTGFPVVLDANVLYGILPTDLLLTTAGQGLYRPHWTDEILDEVRRNLLAKRPDLDHGVIDHRFSCMNSARKDATLPPPAAALVAAMTNHPGDRHVLATAVSINAEVIVTNNIKHFQSADCEPYGVEAQTLDEFATNLVSLDGRKVALAIEKIAERRVNPPETVEDVCTQLARYVPSALAELKQCRLGG